MHDFLAFFFTFPHTNIVILERYLARVSPPKTLPQLAGLYQADGALALNPQQVLTGAWGAAWWEAGVGRASPPTASAAGLCPDPCTNNIAEFFGLRECLRRALRNPGRLLIFELDSMLVVMVMSGIWGCHRAHLRPLLRNATTWPRALQP